MIDSDGCPLRDTFQINQPEELILSVDSSNTNGPRCFGESNGMISLRVQGGNAGTGYTFSWNDNPGRNSLRAENLVADDYTATVVDRLGCTTSLTIGLQEPDSLVYVLNPFDPIICFGDFSDLSIASITGGTASAPTDYQVSINGSSYQSIDQIFQVPGGIPLTIAIVDAIGCVTQGEVTIPSPLPITVELPERVEVELGDSVRLRPNIFPGGAPILFDQIVWTPQNDISFRNGNLADAFVSPISETIYTITVMDEDGCSAQASVIVEVDRNRNVFIPNAFSPNGDRVNDEFAIFTGPGVAEIRFLQVYDRWGEMVYNAENVPLNPFGQTAGWDGLFRGRRVPQGTYIYISEIVFLDGRVITYKGDVNVLY